MAIRDESKYRRAVAAEIDRAIRSSGMTAQDVATKVGTTGQTIGRWRHGADMPTPEFRPKLEKALGMPRGRINAVYGGGSSEMEELRGEVASLREEVAELAALIRKRR